MKLFHLLYCLALFLSLNPLAFISIVQKDYLSGLDQVYKWWLFAIAQNIATIYKLIYNKCKHSYKHKSY
jgi:hypothetical protein